MNKSNQTNDEIRRRIAALKEELGKKKEKLKRSLEKRQTPTSQKRVRFSEPSMAPVEAQSGLESYLLSQNLFDDTFEGEEASNGVSTVLVSCCFLPTHCSVLREGEKTLVSLLCDDAVCLVRPGDVAETLFSRRTKSSRFLLADVRRTSRGVGLMLCELKGRHIVASWLSFDDKDSLVSVFPAAVQDWSQDSSPRASLVWNSASSAALLLVSSSTSSVVTALVWNDAELASQGCRPAESSFGHAFFVTAEHALAVVRTEAKSELGVISLADCRVRRIDRGDRRPLLHCEVLEEAQEAVFLGSLDGEWTISLDCLNTQSWRFLRLRRVSLDPGAAVPQCFCACSGDTLLCLDSGSVRRFSIDWSRQTAQESTHHWPSDVEWIFGCSAFLAWCSRGTVTFLLIPHE